MTSILPDRSHHSNLSIGQDHLSVLLANSLRRLLLFSKYRFLHHGPCLFWTSPRICFRLSMFHGLFPIVDHLSTLHHRLCLLGTPSFLCLLWLEVVPFRLSHRLYRLSHCTWSCSRNSLSHSLLEMVHHQIISHFLRQEDAPPNQSVIIRALSHLVMTDSETHLLYISASLSLRWIVP